MNTPYLKSYYRRSSTFLSSEQIETIRTLKGKVPKYRIIRDFHINENRVNDIWGSHECQQQIIQSVVSSEILPMPTILSKNSNQIEGGILLQNRVIDVKTFTPHETEKLGKISLKTKSPEITQETEDSLELYKRTKKEVKKVKAVMRNDISKLSTPNLKL
ncbi:hypothetical protein Glove_645g49 [Diversispora epigaea]|uniref:Uncharacterized protein n=1 Tax=Diversispora epigaea TaxID=1348612 RepID=A0A397GCN1_9GLOM|nr:hypothetical protein Glove_645g49 [Diversispora epigaea]